MSMFKALSKAVAQTFNAIGTTAQSIEKTMDIANIYVDNNHKKFTRTIKQDAILSTAEHHADIARQLDSDAELKAQYEALTVEW